MRDFLLEQRDHLVMMFRQRINHMQMRRIDADAPANLLDFAHARVILPASHGRRAVIQNNQHHVRVFSDDIHQAGQPRMRERRIPNHGHRREESGIRRALRHRDGRAHVHARVD